MRWLALSMERTPGYKPLHVATLTSFAELFEGGVSGPFGPALYESFSKFKNSGGQVTYQTFNNAFSRIPMGDSDGTNVLHLQQTLYLDVSCIPS
jgi:hypothetical protein